MTRLLMRTITVIVVMLLFGALLLAVSAVAPVSLPGVSQSEEAEESTPAEAESEDEGDDGAEADGESVLTGLTGIARDIGIIVLATMAVSWLGRRSHSAFEGSGP